MHFMLVGAVLHATVLGILAFFVLFAAGKASGFTALLGRLLGYWVLLLAVLGLVIGIGSAVTGKPMMGMMGDKPWMHHWDHMDHMGPPPGAEAPDQKMAPEPDKATPPKS
jgi:hypothetical protein